MKKYLFFILLIAAVSCVQNRSNKQTAQEESKPIQLTTVEYKGVTCEVFERKEDCACIETSQMFIDKNDFITLIDTFKVKEKIIRFYLTDIKLSKIDYASVIGNDVFIYENSPKNWDEVRLYRAKEKLDGSIIIDLEVLEKYKTINVNDIPIIRETLKRVSDCYITTTDADANKDLKKLRQQLKNKLINEQKRLYPKMRDAFAENCRNKLWEENIKVTHSGTTITFIGYIYADNKNIKESCEAIWDALYNLRFKRVIFKWYEGGEYTSYTIKSPNDTDIV